MSTFPERSYFFDTGIQFECQRCGTCCTGEPGIIYISESEISTIAEYLEMEVSSFRKKYLYSFRGGYSILETKEGACLFYKNGCRVYPVRPSQCKTYPFWYRHLRSKQRWQAVQKECPGIGKGRCRSKEEILEIVQSTIPMLK
jgi:Fe-S-cluster containining protein